MRVWFVNQYASFPSVGLPGRHYFLAKELKRYGVEAIVIAGSYNHLRRARIPFLGLSKLVDGDGVMFCLLKVFRYRHASSVTRVINWFLFALLIFGAPFRLGRPDVIVYSSPSPLPYLSCWLLSKLLRCRVIFEVRDIWPLSIAELKGVSPTHPLYLVLRATEKFAYRTAHRLWSNLKYADGHFKASGCRDMERFSWFPNGVLFEERKSVVPIGEAGESYRQVQKLGKEKLVFGYIGSMGEANALDQLIAAIAIHNKSVEDSDLVFVLVGDGQQKEALVEMSRQERLPNVHFFDSVPHLDVIGFIDLFDICYLGTQPRKLYEFGVASLKLPEYMSMKKPIVHSAYRSVVAEAKCGFVVPPSDILALAETMSNLRKLSENELAIMGQRGWQYAKREFDYNTIASRMSAELKLCKRR